MAHRDDRKNALLAFATTISLLLLLTSCMAETSSGGELSGDSVVVVRKGPDGEIAATSVALTIAERDDVQALSQALIHHVVAVRRGESTMGEFSAWVRERGRGDLADELDARINSTKLPKADPGVAVHAEALSYLSTDPWSCFVYYDWGIVDLFLYTGADFTGTMGCFADDPTVHLYLPDIAGGAFYHNIRSMVTVYNGIKTMSAGGLHYSPLADMASYPTVPGDYRIDPYVHGNL